LQLIIPVMKLQRSWRSARFSVPALLVAGCVDAPTAPARLPDLSADYAAFDHPTAVLPDASVPAIAGAFARAGTLPDGTGAFGLIPKLVSDSSQALSTEADLLDQFTVDGTAVARLSCAANATTPTTISTTSFSGAEAPSEALDPSATVVSGGPGTEQLTFDLGVEGSKVQRTLRGSAQNCALLLPGATALPMVSTGSADLMIDLGADLELGAPLTLPILVQATNVRGDSGTTTTAAAIAPTSYEARVTAEGAIELLVQPSAFGAPVSGTVVVTLFIDGRIGVSDQRGTWTCAKGGAPCAFASST
jgi:hypothetical protein